MYIVDKNGLESWINLSYYFRDIDFQTGEGNFFQFFTPYNSWAILKKEYFIGKSEDRHNSDQEYSFNDDEGKDNNSSYGEEEPED